MISHVPGYHNHSNRIVAITAWLVYCVELCFFNLSQFTEGASWPSWVSCLQLSGFHIPHLQKKICFSGLDLRSAVVNCAWILSFDANYWSTSLRQIKISWLRFLGVYRCCLPRYFVLWLKANICIQYLEGELHMNVGSAAIPIWWLSTFFTASGHCGCPEAQHWHYCMLYFCDKCSLICNPSQKS